MNFGKARFIVTKMVGFSRSEFKVKTPTAVIGVRGSDYIIDATEISTQVTTLDEETQLEVSREDDPGDTAAVEGLQTIVIERGISLSPAEDITAEDANNMTQDLTVTPEPEGAVEGVEIDGDQEEEDATTEEGVLVPEEELFDPVEITAPEEIAEIAQVDIIDDPVGSGVEEAFEYIKEAVEYIEESLAEESMVEEPVITELPGLPGQPI